MSDKPLPRPRQVTFSGWSIIVGSVMTILFAFQRVAGLGSLEAQESAADFISTPPGDGLGLSVDDVQLAIRVMCMIAGGAAAATAILGWQALQASRSARVALSVLAPVLFVAGLTSGGLFSALVAAGVTMLWVQPARDWFDGKAGEPVAPRAPAAASVAAPSHRKDSAIRTAPPPSGSSWDLPRPGLDAGPEDSSRTTLTDPALRPGNPYGGSPVAPERGARPGSVTAAGLIAIIMSGVAFAGLVVSVLFVVLSRADFVSQIEEQIAGNSAYDDVAASTIADVAVVFLGVLALWCLAAIVIAVAMLRGSNGARIALIVSASSSALISLLGALVIAPLVITLASVATVVLLFTGSARAWFDGRRLSE